MRINIKNNKTLVVLTLIAIFSLSVRALMHYKFDQSALLYVGLPFLIAIAISVFSSPIEKQSWMLGYWNHFRISLMVMLASSVLLFEGFLCVLMFMPIYFGVMLIGFVIEALYRTLRRRNKNILPLHILPALLLISSLEGVTPDLSFGRYNEVSYSRVVDVDVAQIKRNLQKPISLGEDMPWFLWLFPMPHSVQAESLSEGDVHRSDFRYKRWFFTNIHDGHMAIKLAEVGEYHVRTELLEDTSYIANYLKLHGSLIEMEVLNEAQTLVTLTVAYDRSLDPAWYFGPLERFGVKQAAVYLMDKVIVRDGGRSNG